MKPFLFFFMIFVIALLSVLLIFSFIPAKAEENSNAVVETAGNAATAVIGYLSVDDD